MVYDIDRKDRLDHLKELGSGPDSYLARDGLLERFEVPRWQAYLGSTVRAITSERGAPISSIFSETSRRMHLESFRTSIPVLIELLICFFEKNRYFSLLFHLL